MALRNWLVRAVRCLAVVGFVVSVGGTARAEDTAAEARSVFRSMADYLVKHKALEFTFDSSIDVITPELQKIQYASSGHLVLERPDKMRATRLGGTGELDLYFDGNTATLYGPGIKTYAQITGAHSVDQLIDELEHKYGFAGPGADLLLTNVYDAMMAGVLEARYLGTGIIGGIRCDHVAFRNKETDWQLWVQIGDDPIPRKFIITSKTLAAAPEYTVVVKDWKTGMKIEPGTFAFTPPSGAKKGTVSDLANLDEYPHGTESGDSK